MQNDNANPPIWTDPPCNNEVRKFSINFSVQKFTGDQDFYPWFRQFREASDSIGKKHGVGLYSRVMAPTDEEWQETIDQGTEGTEEHLAIPEADYGRLIAKHKYWTAEAEDEALYNMLRQCVDSVTMARHFHGAVKGSARKALHLLLSRYTATTDEQKQALESQWDQCRPIPNEDIDDWFGRLQLLIDQLQACGKPKTDAEISTHIYSCLRFKPQTATWAQMNLSQRRVDHLLVLQSEVTSAIRDYKRQSLGAEINDTIMLQKEISALKKMLGKKPGLRKRKHPGDTSWKKKATCFNCGKSGHIDAQCKKPKDTARVKKNKAAYFEQKKRAKATRGPVSTVRFAEGSTAATAETDFTLLVKSPQHYTAPGLPLGPPQLGTPPPSLPDTEITIPAYPTTISPGTAPESYHSPTKLHHTVLQPYSNSSQLHQPPTPDENTVLQIYSNSPPTPDEDTVTQSYYTLPRHTFYESIFTVDSMLVDNPHPNDIIVDSGATLSITGDYSAMHDLDTSNKRPYLGANGVGYVMG